LQFLLLIGVNPDLKVLENEIFYVVELEVIRRRVLVLDAGEVGTLNSVEHQQVWSATLVQDQVFTHPPPIALAIDLTRARKAEI